MPEEAQHFTYVPSTPQLPPSPTEHVFDKHPRSNGTLGSGMLGLIMVIVIVGLLQAVQAWQNNNILSEIHKSGVESEQRGQAWREQQKHEHSSIVCLLRIPLEARTERVIADCLSAPTVPAVPRGP